MTATIQKVCDLLKSMGIDFSMTEHKAVFTIDDMMALGLPNTDAIAKNLFVRDDKKRAYYLLVINKDKKAELKSIREKINSRPLTFACEGDLNSILGLDKGSVTPFGIINDEERKVKVIIDRYFENGLIGIHPNENTATVWLDTSDLIKVIRQHGSTAEFIKV